MGAAGDPVGWLSSKVIGAGRVALFGVILFCYMYFLPYVPSLNNPNENTRIYLTQSIVEHGSIAIGWKEMRSKRSATYRDIRGKASKSAFVNDTAIVCSDEDYEPPHCTGPLFAAKAPGSSLLAVPAYAVLSLMGADEASLNHPGLVWLLRLWGIVLPAFGFAVAFFFFVRRWRGDELVAHMATFGLALGTMAFPYGVMVAGHYLQGASLCGAFMLLYAVRHWGFRAHWLFVSGVLAGLAVLFDYPAAMAVILMGVWVLLFVRPLRSIVLFVAGGAGPALFHAWYHWAAFGSPVRTGHHFLETAHNRASQASGFLGIESPTMENLGDTFFSSDVGLFFISPWLFLGAVGLVVWLFSRIDRKEAVLGVVLVLAYTMFVISLGEWRTMLGWTIGPRYMAPTVPFLALGAALALSTMRGRLWGVPLALSAGLILLSVALVTVSTITYPQFNPAFVNPIFECGWALFDQDVVSLSLGTLVGLDRSGSLTLFLVPLVGYAALLVGRVALDGLSMRRLTHALVLLGRAVLTTALVLGLLSYGRAQPGTEEPLSKKLLERAKKGTLWYEKDKRFKSKE